MIEAGKRYLITVDDWFFGPDGESYRAAWGTCLLLRTEDCFNFTPSRPSTNWFMKVGSEEKHVILAGCRIHYAVRSELRPSNHFVDSYYKDKDTGLDYTACRIYFAE